MSTARLVQTSDLESLLRVCQGADSRVYTLPRTRAEWERAIEGSVDAASRSVDVPGEEQYLLVLESDEGELLGVAAIRATAGSQGTYFAFRNDVIHHASRDLAITNSVHVLTLSSDLTEHTQMSSFFVDQRVSVADAAVLSRARLALAGVDRARFAQNFIVSLAGWCDQTHASPFWDALGRKFFAMDFIDAERAVSGGRNRSLIVELMPHYPVYVPMLPPAARAAIGQLHEHARLPFEILSGEGFGSEIYVDIFDGGPILEAHGSKLKTLATSREMTVRPLQGSGFSPMGVSLVATVLQDFRCCASLAALHLNENVVYLPADTLARLRVHEGDRVLVAAG